LARKVLARSDETGAPSPGVVPMPIGFVYVTAVNSRLEGDAPPDQRAGILVFGVPRYRASNAVPGSGAGRNLRRSLDLALLRGARR
jgi:hypothetical protein